MTNFILTTSLWLPRQREQVFPFFADAFNLEEITPAFLRFHVVTPWPITMGEGTLIDYRLRLRWIPIRWRTRIAAWQPPFRFVDEQVRGPYRQWVHEHTFEPSDGGTLCRDRVNYAVWGGRLVNWLVVERDVKAIFAYRQARLNALLGDGEGKVMQPPHVEIHEGAAAIRPL